MVNLPAILMADHLHFEDYQQRAGVVNATGIGGARRHLVYADAVTPAHLDG